MTIFLMPDTNCIQDFKMTVQGGKRYVSLNYDDPTIAAIRVKDVIVIERRMQSGIILIRIFVDAVSFTTIQGMEIGIGRMANGEIHFKGLGGDP